MNTTTTQTLELHEASFLEALKIKHASPSTIASRRDSMTLFARYLTGQQIADVREITRQTVVEYQHWLLAEEYATSTVIIHMLALRRFCEHLERTDVILVNPCIGILLPKTGSRLPKVILTEQEARALLDAPNTQTKVGIRDKAILEVFYSSGIRLAEMTKLTIHDVDYKNGFVRVTKGKGSKDRMVPLGTKACDYVREYLQKVRAEWSKSNRDERALWLSSRHPHAPLLKQAIEVKTKQYAQMIGLEKRVTPHTWRHSCASHMVAKGANIAYVQRLLGHRSLRTTQIYTRTSIADVQRAHAKTHPRGRSRGKSQSAYKPTIGKEGKPLLYRRNQQ